MSKWKHVPAAPILAYLGNIGANALLLCGPNGSKPRLEFELDEQKLNQNSQIEWINKCFLVHTIFHYDAKFIDHDFSNNFRIVCVFPFIVHAIFRKKEGDATIMGVIV